MNYESRRQKLLKNLQAKEVHSVFIQSIDNIGYFSGFHAVVTTRPFGLLLSSDKNILIVPKVAAESAMQEVRDIDISVYYEHPVGAEFGLSFYDNLKTAISGGLDGRTVGVEAGRMSLTDQAVLKELGFTTKDIGGDISRMRSVKEPEELSAIRISAEYVDYMNRRTMNDLRSGISEMELEQAASFTVYQKAAKELPQVKVSISSFMTSGPERTLMVHTSPTMRQIRPSDGILLCRRVGIHHYLGQGDRTCFLGEPTQDQIRCHNMILEAHSAAMGMIRPGIAAADIDKVIRKVFTEYGVEKHYTHQSGAGIGLNAYEPPLLRFDSNDLIESNMAIVVQPALYIPGIGGFRCSDTLVVNDSGAEVLTKNPRNIEALTF